MWTLLLIGWLLIGPAQAEDVDRADLKAWFRSVQPLQPSDQPPVWLREPLVVEDGPLTLTLDDGYVVPVTSGRTAEEWEDEDDPPDLRGDQQVVGFVWVGGQGTLVTRMSDRGDAQRFANRMVRVGGYELDEFAEVARGGPFQTAVTEGLVLGRSAEVSALLAEHLEVDEDVDEAIVVVGERRPAAQALRDAHELFEDRLELYDDARWEVSDWLAIDRLDAEVYGVERRGPHLVVDVHTGHRIPITWFEERTRTTGEEVRTGQNARTVSREWLTAVRDDTGTFDARLQTSVLCLHRVARDDRDDEDELRRGVEVVRLHVAGEPFPPSDPDDPDSAPAPPIRLEARHADATLRVRPWSKDAQVLEVEVSTDVSLQAVGPITVFTLGIPRGMVRKGMPVQVEVRTADGHDVLLRSVDWDESRAWLALPTATEDGEILDLEVRYVAHWTYGHWAGSDLALGTTSGPKSYLPTVGSGQLGNDWTFRTSVGVHSTVNLVAAVSGWTTREWTALGYRWIEAEHSGPPVAYPSVAVGRWHTHVEPPFEGLPGVRVHLLEGRKKVIESFAPEVRRVALFYDRFLPGYPTPEIDVIEDTSSIGGLTWLAPYGMAVVSKAMTAEGHGGLRNDRPHLESGLFAHELAHQYWGQLARCPSAHDRWIAESLAETYATMYLCAAFSDRDREVRMTSHRRRWEKELAHGDVEASLTRAYSSPFGPDIVYRYGPYVLFEMLRPRIGDLAFYQALDGLLVDHPHEHLTTARLRHAFEAEHGESLEDFFLYWVEVGQIPRLKLQWTPEKEGGTVRVVGEITSDVPFGTFDVPVRVIDASDNEFDTWVQVVDGTGSLRTRAVHGTSVRVKLDPDHLVLARARKVSREKGAR